MVWQETLFAIRELPYLKCGSTILKSNNFAMNFQIQEEQNNITFVFKDNKQKTIETFQFIIQRIDAKTIDTKLVIQKKNISKSQLFKYYMLYQYTYKVDQSIYFSQFQRVKKVSILQVKQIIRENFDKFKFQLPKITFNGQEQMFKYVKGYRFNPYEAICLSILAAQIIDAIKKDKLHTIGSIYENFFGKIQQQQRIKYFYDQDGNKQDLNNQEKNMIIQAQKKASKVFKGIFEFSQQGETHHYNQKIFTQQRFKEASFAESNLVYIPTYTTAQIFRIAELLKEKAIYFHGQSGIGKSISLSLLVLLHNFIDHLRNNFKYSEYSHFPTTFDLTQLQNYPKYFYFTISEENLDNMKRFYNAMKEQIPYKLEAQDNDLLDTIDSWPKYQKIKIIYVIDQINIYYSLQRMKRHNPAHKPFALEVLSLSNLLVQLSRKYVLFGSSQNYERLIANQQNPKGFCLRKIITNQPKKIKYEYERSFPQKQLELVRILEFQNLNQIKKHNIFDPLSQLFKLKKETYKTFKQFFKNNDDDHQLDQCFFQLSHQRIKYCFKSQPSLIAIGFNSPINFKTLTDFMRIFHDCMINSQSKKCQQFLNKQGDAPHLIFYKYNQLEKIRIYAMKLQNEKTQKSNLKFTIQAFNNNKFQYDDFYKERIQVSNDKMTVYYCPSTFRKITDFMVKKKSLLQEITDRVVQINDQNNSTIGSIFDNVHTYIFSKYQLLLTLDETIKTIKGFNNDEHFTHFSSMFSDFFEGKINFKKKEVVKQVESKINQLKITKKTSIYNRFKPLFASIDNLQFGHQKITYVCAAPKTKSDKTSTNSQVIDFLLIRKEGKNEVQIEGFDDFRLEKQLYQKKQSKKYRLKTYDFTVSQNQSSMTQKINKAMLFFLSFMHIAKLQNTYQGAVKANNLINPRKYKPIDKYQFIQLTHTFIGPINLQFEQKTINYGQGQNQVFKIRFFPINNMKFSSDEQIDAVQHSLSKSLIRLFTKQKA